MSGWTLETDDSFELSAAQRGNNHASAGARGNATEQRRSKARRAFFDGDDDVEKGSSGTGLSDKQKRDSLTLASAAAISRRSQRNSRSELVVDESDEDETANNDFVAAVKPTKTTIPETSDGSKASGAPMRLSIAVKDERGSSKSDELVMADVTRRASVSTSEETTDVKSEATGMSGQYVHWLVRDFLQRTYPRGVLDVFDKENPAPVASGDATATNQLVHRQLTGATDASDTVTALEKLLVVWDSQVHHRTLVRPRSQSTASASSSSSSSSSGSSSSSSSSKSKSSSSRKKPQLSVTIASDAPASDMSPSTTGGDEIDYNRLNHPGHTPKAQQNELLAAVMGEPGSTPKASAGELKALGFEDIDDTDEPVSRTRTHLIPSNAAEDCEDDDDELSLYAKRKRGAQRHNKHVYIGEQGHTPTKEYVFFRETPPRFVTETVEGAEEILRSLGGNPDVKRQQIAAAKLERFVELQSSDVAKYSVGQRVENLGAQRNITGLVSKLYGSRLCGSAGPGTIVIDTWMGSDTAPEAAQLGEDDEELIDQLLE